MLRVIIAGLREDVEARSGRVLGQIAYALEVLADLVPTATTTRETTGREERSWKTLVHGFKRLRRSWVVC